MEEGKLLRWPLLVPVPPIPTPFLLPNSTLSDVEGLLFNDLEFHCVFGIFPVIISVPQGDANSFSCVLMVEFMVCYDVSHGSWLPTTA